MGPTRRPACGKSAGTSHGQILNSASFEMLAVDPAFISTVQIPASFGGYVPRFGLEKLSHCRCISSNPLLRRCHQAYIWVESCVSYCRYIYNAWRLCDWTGFLQILSQQTTLSGQDATRLF